MTFNEARKKLIDAGYELLRYGRGSHVIFQKGKYRIVISCGNELSNGQTKKVTSFLRK